MPPNGQGFILCGELGGNESGKIKVNGLAVLPEFQHRGIGQMHTSFMNIWVIKNYHIGSARKYKVKDYN